MSDYFRERLSGTSLIDRASSKEPFISIPRLALCAVSLFYCFCFVFARVRSDLWALPVSRLVREGTFRFETRPSFPFLLPWRPLVRSFFVFVSPWPRSVRYGIIVALGTLRSRPWISAVALFKARLHCLVRRLFVRGENEFSLGRERPRNRPFMRILW